MMCRLRCAAAALVADVLMLTAAPSDARAEGLLPASYTAPPAPAGSLDDLGSPMTSLTVVEGAFGTLPDGTLAAYAAPMGENAELNVSTITGTTKQLGRYPMTGASGAPTIAVAPDGTVYLGTFYDGHLFSWDPATEKMTDLGRPVSGASYLYGLTVAPDGTVYGGTYPNAHAFSYHPGRGFTDLGVASDNPDVQYVRSAAIDAEHNALYVGLQPVPGIVRIDLATGARSTVDVAAVPKATSVSDLDVEGGRLFANVGGMLRVVDTATNKEISFTATGAPAASYPLSARGVSPARDGKVYFSSTQAGKVQVVAYDTRTDAVAPTGKVATRGALIGYGWATENDQDVLYGWAGNYSGGGFRYDIDANTSGSLQFQVTAPPSPLQHVLPSADGAQVYVNAFLNGNGVVYDTTAKTYSPIARLGQVEDWTLIGDDIGAGTYPTGTLLRYDPAAPATSTNPTSFVTLKDTASQIRPLDVQTRDGLLYAASEPDYGLRGGALSIVDLATNEVQTTRGIVPDHTLAAIAFGPRTLYLGSSTEGGTGTTPVAGEAQLVEWDPATKQVLHRTAPVPGAQSINALVPAPHGGLYGLADGTLFAFNPKTWRVTRRLDLGLSGGFPAGTGEIVVHPNGYLYVSAGQRIVAVDPLAFTARTEPGRTHRLELSADRSLYTLIAPDGFTNFLHLGRYVPAKTACATPDTRPFVTLAGRVTTVRNRFLITGCTLQDLFPRTADKPKSYAGTVNPWLDRLVEQGQISKAERDALWKAAR